MSVRIINGDCIEVLRKLPDESVHCCVTSPPYWGLRDYGTAKWEGGDLECDHKQESPKERDFYQRPGETKANGFAGTSCTSWSTRDVTVKPGNTCRKCGAARIDSQLGLESTPQEYVEKMVAVFREVRRVLRDDGTLWLNLGDSYASSGGGYDSTGSRGATAIISAGTQAAVLRDKERKPPIGLKPKDLCGIPWRVAFALQADGWYLRQDIIWCLSGGTVVYARTQKGDMPMTLKDMARLDPATVQLWNGERWTQLLGMSKARRRATELTLVLRSGERVSCTPTHNFPTSRGLLDASQIKTGDRLMRVRLPEPDAPKSPTHVSDDAAWFAGLYLAEGSMAGDTIQIAGHAKEAVRWERLQRVATAYGGSATRTVHGNSMNVRLYGKLLVGLVREFVSGKTAINKHIASAVWRYSDRFLAEYLRGYLDGDGHWEEKNQRWRLGFCRNYALEQDLRTACARLDWTLTINPTVARFQNGTRPSFKGELRMTRSGHHNERSRDDVVRIERGRCRWVYDVGVADEPHLFALATGILTHNSKPNPMPESVRDRCTKAHEYLFLLAKSEKYYCDMEAIHEPAIGWNGSTFDGPRDLVVRPTTGRKRTRGKTGYATASAGPFGSPQQDSYGGLCEQGETRNKRSVWTVATQPFKAAHFATFPPALIEPCILAGCPIGGTVLDPFFGAGTTGLVADRLQRDCIGIELNPEYAAMAEKRIKGDSPLFAELVA